MLEYSYMQLINANNTIGYTIKFSKSSLYSDNIIKKAKK